MHSKNKRSHWLASFGAITSSACLSLSLALAPHAQAVPIDITDAAVTIRGATTFYMENISTMGSSYWADFRWDEKANAFRPTDYGEMETEPPEGFVLIPAGTFIMGSPSDELARVQDETQHKVTLTKAFYFSKTEVTTTQWEDVLGPLGGNNACDNCAVGAPSWFEAVDYCNALSEKQGLKLAYDIDGENVKWNKSANGYRLPTEAEWEYACRAGSETAFYNGPITDSLKDPNLDKIGWYRYNSGDTTHTVATKEPNAWGLYDMSGNVWEHCWDWHGSYPGTVTDPTGPDRPGVDKEGIVRGGAAAWWSSAHHCRSARRYRWTRAERSGRTGFRVARWAP